MELGRAGNLYWPMLLRQLGNMFLEGVSELVSALQSVLSKQHHHYYFNSSCPSALFVLE